MNRCIFYTIILFLIFYSSVFISSNNHLNINKLELTQNILDIVLNLFINNQSESLETIIFKERLMGYNIPKGKFRFIADGHSIIKDFYKHIPNAYSFRLELYFYKVFFQNIIKNNDPFEKIYDSKRLKLPGTYLYTNFNIIELKKFTTNLYLDAGEDVSNWATDICGATNSILSIISFNSKIELLLFLAEENGKLYLSTIAVNEYNEIL